MGGVKRDQISWSTSVQWEMDTRNWCVSQWRGNKSGWLKSRLYALYLQEGSATQQPVSAAEQQEVPIVQREVVKTSTNLREVPIIETAPLVNKPTINEDRTVALIRDMFGEGD